MTDKDNRGVSFGESEVSSDPGPTRVIPKVIVGEQKKAGNTPPPVPPAAAGRRTGNPSLEKRVSALRNPPALAVGAVAGLVMGMSIGAVAYVLKAPEIQEVKIPVQSSIVDRAAVEESIKKDYETKIKETQDYWQGELEKERAKPATIQTVAVSPYYSMIKKDTAGSSSALLTYVESIKPILAGNLRIKGKTCDEGLSNLYTLMVSPEEAKDEETKRAFIENNRGSCRNIREGDEYLLVKVVEEEN